MHLIVGLGNPGRQYLGTRHNVGFGVVDLLAERFGLAFEAAPADAVMARQRGPEARVMLAKPLTYMNRSGWAVQELQHYYRIEPEALLVVADDVNLPLGKLRARPEGSDGGHNGLSSIIASLGTFGFARLRLGVGRGDERRDLANHVLARFERDEMETVEEMIERAADAVETFIADGIEKTMNRFN
ncbi:MAG: aminoacyl-tRNA hydrolase [Acidobacteria bacterium]|nr:aminoacyl-tRNA hydrolase [Acidobacteriota bacterium]MYJ06179.1 aminoacyl-tRNA hydrolase [Acidobacteriota bacterium]